MILELLAIGSVFGGSFLSTFLIKKYVKKSKKEPLDLFKSKIESLSNILELKIKNINDINLLDVFYMNKILLNELYKEITVLKNYDVSVVEHGRLNDILIRLESLIVVDEESAEIEEIIMSILLNSVKLVKVMIKTKSDEVAYEQYENELLKKDVANELLSEYEKESLRNQYTNEYLELKKGWVNHTLNDSNNKGSANK